MTDSEFFKKYPEKDYKLEYVHSKESGFQDSIEETTYNIIDRKSGNNIGTVKKTEVTNRGSEPTIFWEE
ncbi:hypothetical protein AABV78_001420 [Enterobacter hormaechei]